MNNQIICPHCGEHVEITEVLRRQIEVEVGHSLTEKHRKEIQEVRLKIQEETKKKLQDEFYDKNKELAQELEEKTKRLETFREQELQLRKEKRDLEEREKELQLEVEKRIDEERKKVQEAVEKRVFEDYRLKDKEKEKMIEDLKNALEDARRKAVQGSQQMQGEILELDIEDMLRQLFPFDSLEEVGKGIRGADIRHIVKSKFGRYCGMILWEFKNTKAWSDGWIVKLKDDMRNAKADIPVIVSTVLPPGMSNGIGMKDGVWMCDISHITPLALLVRDKVHEVAKQKFINENRGDKKDAVYEYVTGNEFRQQVEAVVEVYQNMMVDIEKERAAFERMWKKREMQVRRLISSTGTIYGSMQGLVGSSMPQVKGLELPELDSGEEHQLLTSDQNNR
ncbi:hypothetical protein A3B56_03145 [Candidatus Roizmanbacteria bacterium RIFCSPLOWO2_01_FULL_45_11]|uniref:DUF2130 domain-containing protein n=1 Tax=Candidatus Roizmanbacteria bacterium RIFCSPLOWO2_01_FULL_45_11 TaxID=1802070 RepID=A0A1F7JHH3_9BACT|nr:MAG: hypothetical protein A3B56_03145 [Candidatus Roizmanbacteria bacterium RIFCSPLOWO2_01_FULL_45_11]